VSDDRMIREARLRMFRTAGRYKSERPLGVHPSRGAFSDHDWDVFTSMCDARTALVLALGRRPDPCTGHTAPEPNRSRASSASVQLDLFEVAA